MNGPEIYKCLFDFRKPLLERIVKSINIPLGTRGLDAGCGIGLITELLAHRVGYGGHVTGLDLSKDFLSYAKKQNTLPNTSYLQGDINNLPFEDNFFDWIWSIDTVWPGPKEMGCPAEKISGILDEYYRVIKPGGKVFLLYWTSQKILPGYPLLEARLNTTSGANAPFSGEMPPSNHVMNAKEWLENAGFKPVSPTTFVGNVSAPLNQNDKKALQILIQMFWGASEQELGSGDWHKLSDICDQAPGKSIFDNPTYYGFYTYTLFSGIK